MLVQHTALNEANIKQLLILAVCNFNMIYLVAPRIIQHPGTRLEIKDRENLVMDCVIQGNPAPEVQWE